MSISTTSFQKILSDFRKYSFSEHDKGHRFERLIQAYLKTDPMYANSFTEVWLWNDFPFKKDFGGRDTGIDLVARTVYGDYWAIQCKCYEATTTIDKAEVDSFLSTSSRQFTDHNYRRVGFTHRLWISTTNHWGANAQEAILNQDPPVSRINLSQLETAPVDWEKIAKGLFGEQSRPDKKIAFQHQIDAINRTHEHFKTSERGKLIMACGTGKTFTALRIAEKETAGKGLILFLVPSIALLGQTLREWSAEADEPLNAICICSDSAVSQTQNKNNDTGGFSSVDLALPASTNVEEIVRQFTIIQNNPKPGMTVVFSTYQSIDVIAKAQAELAKSNNAVLNNGIFDLIICDEAHRTTGVTLKEEDESAFVKVHDGEYLRSKHRLYMTATPRLYNADSQTRAEKAEAILCSMDDETLYGKEIYRIGFGEAVEKGLLTEYKVLILTVTEDQMPRAVQDMVKTSDNEIDTSDVSKLIGCINALSKKVLVDADIITSSDPDPMRRAVAFCQSIKISKKITTALNVTKDLYFESLTPETRTGLVSVNSDHVDGTMSAPLRDEKIAWLKQSNEDTNECRILTNVRCLSEGVDVPSLDAVLFLSARNSQIDVVQSVGRVMRKAPGKKYGYIIIPVVIPTAIEADKALDTNKRYEVVWSVLNALRAHDDRFNSTINKIELNKKRPDQILVGRPDYGSDSDGTASGATDDIQRQFALQFEQLQGVVFARMVQKVGDRRYWEQWAKEVAQIAERHITRITELINNDTRHQQTFASFLVGLQRNINPSITRLEAVEMLAQHIITKPVFEALFEGYSFVKNNPISIAMQTMLDLLEEQTLPEDVEKLEKFYQSVKSRASGIDNAEGRQRIIIELYDKFFKTAFPKMVEKLGIVYTPVEVVDFIIHSVEWVLKKEFDRSITDENIHILDPFTGTGTFITRLLQSGLIAPEDAERKYTNELHANEIVLLAYYIAAINIENAFHDLPHNGQDFKSFNGICLTDTFQLGEIGEAQTDSVFPRNSERVDAQRNAPLRVIMGNPPYSVGQNSANDNAQNQSYPLLDKRIAETYAKDSSATSVKALYDSYIKAFRWSSDRLMENNEHGGVIAFVSNGAWLDSNGMDSFRKCIESEFSTIYVFNLRGNQRTSGELSRKEGGKIFGSGSRTPIAVTFLVKKPTASTDKATIYYHDIGDYLNREDKLSIISKFGSIGSEKMEWQILEPNEHGDWIKQRNNVFGEFIPLASENKYDPKSQSFFLTHSLGLASGRDSWVYNFSPHLLEKNIKETIQFYNEQSQIVKVAKDKDISVDIDSIIDTNPHKISWNRNLKQDVEINKIHTYDELGLVIGSYRPFCKNYLYFNKYFNAMLYQIPKLFPTSDTKNLVICVSGIGVTKEFSTIITDIIPDLELIGKSQCFPLYYYEKQERTVMNLWDTGVDAPQFEYVRRDGISDFILEQARSRYGNSVTKEDIFYYVYGMLHCTEYREQFSSDLKKMLPRLPLVDEPKKFGEFSKAGRKLAELHLNYEQALPMEGVKVDGYEHNHFAVQKMRFPSKDDKSTILFNQYITISNIPAEAYRYIVNGKSAIEWIMERYAITTNKDSGITNNPNDWMPENPRYIFNLLLSIIRVSVETVRIVEGLGSVGFGGRN